MCDVEQDVYCVVKKMLYIVWYITGELQYCIVYYVSLVFYIKHNVQGVIQKSISTMLYFNVTFSYCGVYSLVQNSKSTIQQRTVRYLYSMAQNSVPTVGQRQVKRQNTYLQYSTIHSAASDRKEKNNTLCFFSLHQFIKQQRKAQCLSQCQLLSRVLYTTEQQYYIGPLFTVLYCTALYTQWSTVLILYCYSYSYSYCNVRLYPEYCIATPYCTVLPYPQCCTVLILYCYSVLSCTALYPQWCTVLLLY